MKQKKLWKVFYYNEKKLCAYTMEDTFNGEEEATKRSLAYENGIDINDIKVVIEER